MLLNILMASSKDYTKKISFDSIVTKIIKEGLVIKDNVYYSERLFVAYSIILWIFNNKNTEEQKKFYIDQLQKHLNKEITLYWEDGIVKIARNKKRG